MIEHGAKFDSGFTSMTVTSRCNLKCAMCMNGFPGGYEELAPDLIRRILSGLYVFGWRGVTYTGGEPMTHTKFEEIVDIALSEDYAIGLVTNGWFYDKYRSFLAERAKRIAFVSISVDGVDAATHDAIRGQPGSFARTLDAVEAFGEMGVSTLVQMVISKANQHQVRPFVDLFEPLADGVTVLATIGSALSRDMMLTEEEMAKIHAEINTINAKYARLSVASSVGMQRGVNFCDSLGWDAVHINAGGQMVFCCDSLYDGAVVGDCNKESVAEILPRYGQIRQRMIETRIKELACGKGDGYKFNSCNWCNENLRDIIKVVPQNERIYKILGRNASHAGVVGLR